jgi:hypothetical protein
MTEDFLHYLWMNQLFFKENLKSIQGEELEIIHPGVANSDAGPDFFNARIKIGNTIWVGNIEIHVHSSDWVKHKHQSDKAYENVILHVVADHDIPVVRESGEELTTLELVFDERLYRNYIKLVYANGWIPCQDRLSDIEKLFLNNWMDRLATERLELKSGEILKTLEANQNDWEETLYHFIGRSFGFRLNSDPFGLLTKAMPLRILLKHSENLCQIEALLFGQAGFLDSGEGDEYYMKLRKEYIFLKKKYSLKSLEKYLWKFLRLRPSNFPTIRIAQFSALIFKHHTLFSSITETISLHELRDLFNVLPNEYWLSHYQFNKKSIIRQKRLGKQAVDSLIINAIVPVLFTYGRMVSGDSYKDSAQKILQELPAELNSIITSWKRNQIIPDHAMDSQALIHLKNHYCDKRKCLKCAIGNKILLKAIV